MSAFGFSLFPFQGTRFPSNVTFPLPPSQVAPAPIPILQTTLTPPYGQLSAFDPALKLPYTLQWNVSVEQSLGMSQTVSASYVGAVAKRLVQLRNLNLSSINPNFTFIYLTTNKAT